MTFVASADTSSATAEADSSVSLEVVTVTGQRRQDIQMRTSQAFVTVNQDYMQEHFASSLMQTLGNIPGVKAMNIGAGQSKPAIRGMGSNRMVVCVDGIKHEGQQWGDDHGLEIDQFATDRIEIIKGPAALLYGSDAIGGVLNLYSNYIPSAGGEGSLKLFGQTNSEQAGISLKYGNRFRKWYYKANVTFIDYADYKVPVDSIQYYSYYIRLKDGRLRNTAGKEHDGSLTVGFKDYRLHSFLRFSDSYSKSGFFANAHGLEVRLSGIDYDESIRDIDLPYQWVNHFKIQNHTSWTADSLYAEMNIAFQNNVREERSEPVSHGYMPMPDGSLERRFSKNTFSAGLKMRLQLPHRHELNFGMDGEFQHNRRDGWGFILPDFKSASFGLYAMDKHTVNKNLKLNAGVRFDAARTHIYRYEDWYKTPTADGDSAFVSRSPDSKRAFRSLTWSAGLSYNIAEWVFKANVGKAFRLPIAKELGANGINYHIFRYEKGNADMDPESSYQVDLGIDWSNHVFSFHIDPFFNYFPNYIYLSPTADYLEGLQLYHYTQSEVMRYGIEAQADYSFTPLWKAQIKGDYLYAKQLSGEKKGYTLPFSPPWTLGLCVKHIFKKGNDDLRKQGYVSIKANIVGEQSEIVPPEKPTDGYWTLGFSAGKNFPIRKTTLKATFSADNLLNKCYYDHTSYYRLIDVPEPGRNFSLMIVLDF